jgi:hypothetical protein
MLVYMGGDVTEITSELAEPQRKTSETTVQVPEPRSQNPGPRTQVPERPKLGRATADWETQRAAIMS